MHRPSLLHTWCPSKFLLIDFFQSLCACGTQPVFPISVFLPRPFFIGKIFTTAVFCVPAVQIVQHFLPLGTFLRVRPEMRPSVFGRCSAYPSAVRRDQKPSVFRYSRSVPEIESPVYSNSTKAFIYNVFHVLTPLIHKSRAQSHATIRRCRCRPRCRCSHARNRWSCWHTVNGATK